MKRPIKASLPFTVTSLSVGFLAMLLLSGGAVAQEPADPGAQPAPDATEQTTKHQAGRAFLGVRLTEVPPALAGHFEIEGGALVEEVLEGGPAAHAGLRARDIVVEIAGEPASGPMALVEAVRSRAPGAKLALVVVRDAERVALEATLGTAVPPTALLESELPGVSEGGFLGVRYEPVHPSVAAHLGLELGVGVSVAEVVADSPAARAGIAAHDVLTHLGDEALDEPGELSHLLSARRPGEKIALRWIHRGSEHSATVELVARPATLAGRSDALESPFEPERRHFLKGRVIWKDATGKEHVFEMPEFGVPDPGHTVDEWQRELEKHWKHWKDFPRDAHERLNKLIEEYHSGRPRGSWPTTRSWSDTSTAASVRVVEDGFEITVSENNGVRTVSVKKDGTSLADGLAWDELGTLPDDVRTRVERAAESLPAMSRRELEGGDLRGPQLPDQPPGSDEKRVEKSDASRLKV